MKHPPLTLTSVSAAALAVPTATHCPYCSLQCGILMVAGNRPATLQPQEDFPTNRGGLCSKGWTAANLLDHKDRLLNPLVRTIPGDRASPLRPASWDEALDLVAAGITAHPAAVRPGRCRGLRRRRPDQREGLHARQIRPGGAADLGDRLQRALLHVVGRGRGNRAFGVDRGLPFPLSDIAEAAAILLVGANPADTMPPAMQYFDEGRAAGGQHIVVDPRRHLDRDGATLHLAPTARHRSRAGQRAAAHRDPRRPGRRGVHRRAHHRIRGGRRPRSASYWPDRVERITGVRVAAAAGDRAHALADGAVGDDPDRPRRRAAQQGHRHGSGLHQSRAGPRAARPTAAPATARITGQGNGQGGREHGQKADQLPGYRRIDDPAARAHVAAVWGVDPEELPRPGQSAFEMLDRMGTDGGVRALLVLGSNIVGLRTGRRPGARPARARWTCWWCPTSSCPRRPRWPMSCCRPRSGPRRTAP